MKRLMGILAIALFPVAVSAQAAKEPVPVFSIHKPTIIAFFVSNTGSQTQADAEDDEEALADYQYYVGLALPRLRKAGVDFEDVDAPIFKVNVEGNVATFRVDKITVGYYFVAPGKEPHVEYGVMTDSNMIDLARRYFGISIP